MNISILNTFFSYLAIIAVSLSFISIVGKQWTGNILDKQKAIEIASLKSRHLTESQKSDLLALISNKSDRICFMSLFTDGESSDFADELDSIFRQAKWEVLKRSKTSLNDFDHLGVFYTSDDRQQSAYFVCESLQKIGLDCRWEMIRENSVGGPHQPNAIYVVIGRKPKAT